MLVSEVMHLVQASRLALAETLLAAGPTANTLCDGWETRHLVAHLVIRERSALAAGVVFKPLSKKLDAKIEELAAAAQSPEGYAALIRTFRSGPAKYSPFAIDKFDQAANLSEYFIHTEDVRRARGQWAPRVLDKQYTEMLWQNLTRASRMLFRKAPVGIILTRPDGQRHVAKKAPNAVSITGPVTELMLYGFGRIDQSLVLFEGGETALEIVKGFKPGL
ncbi:TIGR03085 family metal-binding protein [Glutamicibacter sp. JC586]|uniref:TIGR03085 family metal-binding protein n=1 Tax=Glutamicibacter sp. JC586 TaxID=2590552 RepID=UPI001358ABD4|nr:TIGR03085 family metal-binding protein [Glutamicibacter sp. JC586]